MDYVKESALLHLLAQPRLRPEALKPCNLCIQFARRLKVSKNRDIGREILQGLRELKRGEAGRVVNLPPVSEIRRKVGLSQSRFCGIAGRTGKNITGLGTGAACAIRRCTHSFAHR